MDREKLIALREMLLHDITDEQFDMGWWLYNAFCGTVGCAAGWGIKKGILDGLELVPESAEKCSPQNFHPHIVGSTEEFSWTSSDWGYGALVQELGLPNRERARWIFDPDCYSDTDEDGELIINVSRQTVAKRIEEMLK